MTCRPSGVSFGDHSEVFRRVSNRAKHLDATRARPAGRSALPCRAIFKIERNLGPYPRISICGDLYLVVLGVPSPGRAHDEIGGPWGRRVVSRSGIEISIVGSWARWFWRRAMW